MGRGTGSRGVLHVLAVFCALRCVFVFRNNACFFRVCRSVILLFFLLIFSCTFCCAFRTLRIRRVCVCAAETRQLTKRVLFCSCSLSRSLFVELCVCTAVSPSFALTPPPSRPLLHSSHLHWWPPASFIVTATNAGHACFQSVYYATDTGTGGRGRGDARS